MFDLAAQEAFLNHNSAVPLIKFHASARIRGSNCSAACGKNNQISLSQSLILSCNFNFSYYTTI